MSSASGLPPGPTLAAADLPGSHSSREQDGSGINRNSDGSRHREGMLSVLVVDSHLVSRYGVKQLLTEEFRGIIFGEARTKNEALEELERYAWQVVTLEIHIPGNRGLR